MRTRAHVLQCLLFALAVDTPDDPREYLKDKVRELKLRGIRHWDMLIPVGRRPPMPTRPYWLSRGDPWDKDEVRPRPLAVPIAPPLSHPLP